MGQHAQRLLFANEWLRDRFVRLHASNAPEPRILVVDIDEASLAKLGPWPWPRDRIADLVETLLTHYGARGVALDIVLPEPAGGQGDARLALLAQHGPLVLAQAFDFDGRPEPLRDGELAGASARYPGGRCRPPATSPTIPAWRRRATSATSASFPTPTARCAACRW